MDTTITPPAINLLVYTYTIYLSLSIGLTVWVARTLFKHGRIFLVDAFTGNEALADSVNHLLIVGFYLINIGYVSLALREYKHPQDASEIMEMLSYKIGYVLVVLGGMHFFNLFVFSRIRKRGMATPRPQPRAAIPQAGVVVHSDLTLNQPK